MELEFEPAEETYEKCLASHFNTFFAALEVAFENVKVPSKNKNEKQFKKELKNQLIITSVVFKLQKNPDINISYGAIQSVLDDKGVSNPTIKDISDTIITIRQSKLPDPKKVGNAGSFFKNPVISTSLYKKLQTKHSSIPGYPIDGEQIKVPAGWLIEQAGWKGKTIGPIGVHKNQALVLVNYGNGNGNEIKKLAYMIKADIFQKFEINISLEVNVL